MLLVDDDQPEAAEVHLCLKQRMRTDNNRSTAAADCLQGRRARLALQFPGMPDHGDTQRLQPVTETAEMLFRQQLGRRHQCHLVTGLHHAQCRAGSHYCFTGADVTLYQPRHRMRTRKILTDIVDHPLLCTGQRKRQGR